MVLGHSGGQDKYGCHAGSQPYHCHGGGYSGGGSSSRSLSPQEKRRALRAYRRDNQVVLRQVLGEGWWTGRKYLIVLITYASGRTEIEHVYGTATSVPSSTGGSSPQTSTSTTSTTTTLAPSVPPQIIGIRLGRDYDRETQNGVVGTSRYMRQVIELQIKADPRSLPLELCWNVTANGAKFPWWQWSTNLWTYSENKAGTGCFTQSVHLSRQNLASSPDGSLLVELHIDYRDKDWYLPVPYVPRAFGVSATVKDIDGRSVSSELLTFVK